MTEENLVIPRRPARRRHKPIRWLSGLVVLGVVLVSGTILADVVLVYTANSSVGGTVPGPYQFKNGANYAVASGLGIASTTFVGGGGNGPGITTTVNGIVSVGVSVLDVAEFGTAAPITNTAHIGPIVVPTPATISVPGLLCAYVFISNALPTGAGVTGVAGAPAGCSATIPTLGALSPGCIGSGPATVVTLNLSSGLIIGPNFAGQCSMGALGSGITILYISYWITASGPIVGPAALNVFTIPVLAP